jgi:large subunit ribosomal protein L18
MANEFLNRRQKIHKRIRKKVFGTAERPRLTIFRSNKQVYVQLVNDVDRITLLSFNSIQLTKESKTSKIDLARKVGESVARLALDKGISTIAFDRSGYLYHGRIKSLADGARGTLLDNGSNELLQF